MIVLQCSTWKIFFFAESTNEKLGIKKNGMHVPYFEGKLVDSSKFRKSITSDIQIPQK